MLGMLRGRCSGPGEGLTKCYSERLGADGPRPRGALALRSAARVVQGGKGAVSEDETLLCWPQGHLGRAVCVLLSRGASPFPERCCSPLELVTRPGSQGGWA